MSMNLYLAYASKDQEMKRCDLHQTPTTVTWQILEAKSNYDIMMEYFKWIDSNLGKREYGMWGEIGATLDHKLKVAMFLVKYPTAEWYAG